MGISQNGNFKKFGNAEENLMSVVIQDLKGHYRSYFAVFWSKLLIYLSKNVFAIMN